jgi:hypothetical protein
MSRAAGLGAPTHMTKPPAPFVSHVRNLSVALGIVLASGLGGACGTSVPALSADGGAARGGAAGASGQGGGAAGTGAAGAQGTGGSSLGVDAGGKIPVGTTQCSDGIDNDGDGLIDSADPECTGPNDNDESTFGTGIPGDNVDPCKQDCFFDGNSGMGDDGCLWELKCDPQSTEKKCPYDASYAQSHAMECSVSASQSQHCIDFCQRYVPNGCDCFGCCAVPGAATPIRLAATCTAKDFGDPTKCPPCTQVAQCSNPCDRCELCVGKDTVPADCTGGSDGGPTTPDASLPPGDGGTGAPTCNGWVSCVPGPNAVCPDGYGCVTGCCLPRVQ